MILILFIKKRTTKSEKSLSFSNLEQHNLNSFKLQVLVFYINIIKIYKSMHVPSPLWLLHAQRDRISVTCQENQWLQR
jgi:hypothetical protein